jgi:hypothetical protein
MLFGPLPIVFAEKLRQMLQAQGSDGKIFFSADETPRLPDVLNRGPQPYPIFEQNRDLVYIEIEQKDLLIVRGELDKLGFSVPPKKASPIPGEDFLCPKCDFHGDSPGICPNDGTSLLPFSEWIERKQLWQNQRKRIFAWLVLGAMAAAGLLRAYTILTGD